MHFEEQTPKKKGFKTNFTDRYCLHFRSLFFCKILFQTCPRESPWGEAGNQLLLDPVTIIKFGQIFQNLTLNKSMIYVALQIKIQQGFSNIQGLKIQTQMQKIFFFWEHAKIPIKITWSSPTIRLFHHAISKVKYFRTPSWWFLYNHAKSQASASKG